MLISARLCMSWTSSFEPPVSSYSIRAIIMYMYVSYIHPFHGALRMIFGSRRRQVSTKTGLKRPLLVLCRCMLQTVRKGQRSHPIFIIMARVRVGMFIDHVCTTPNPSVSVMAEEHPMKPQIISRVAQSRRERKKEKKATYFAQ